ncbi:MAG: hypothetical protein HZB42_06125 [Sphingobacteriales bacterium]|nr:hypothetical protein [Sphingobacteriales bacterium]
MKQKMTKTAYKIILGLFMLTVTAVACNNDGKDKEKETTDSAATKPTAPGDKMTPDNNMMADSTKIDSANTKPTAPGD